MTTTRRAASPNSTRRQRKYGWLASIAAAAALCLAQAAYAQGDQAVATPLEFNIPAQPVPMALSEFAKQARVQLLFISDGFENVVANPVIGSYATQQALDLLLAGTGLSASISEDAGVKVQKVAVAGGAAFVQPQEIQGRRRRPNSASASLQSSTESKQTPPEEDERGERAPNRLEEIVVTGTSIRGVIPESTPLEIFDATDIRNTGALTAEQFVATLPQNNNTLSEVGPGTSSRETNVQAANSVDLRGLGVGTTLVLLNGRRVAPSASGRSPDLSFIPLEAVERIEVLNDGASAIYGADAIGGVVNFVLKDRQDGAATVLSYGAANGGNETLRIDQSLGRSWAGGDAFVALSYMDRNPLDASDRSYSAEASPLSLVPKDSRKNLLLTASQSLPLDFSVSGDLLLAARRPRLVHKQALADRVIDNHLKNDQAVANLEVSRPIGDKHRAALLLTYSEADVDEHTVRIGLEGESLGSTFRTDETATLDVTAKIDGKLASIRGRDWLYALGTGYSQDKYERFLDNTGVGGGVVSTALKRNTKYAFTELFVPLLTERQNVPGIRRLEATLAARYTNYSDFGGKLSPKIGVLWSPIPSLRIRSTLGESFKAPFLYQLDRTSSTFLLFQPAAFGYPDIWTPDGSAIMFIARDTGNPDQGPEEARTSTLGFDFDFANFAVSATYINIDYTDRLAEPDPSGGFVTLSNPQDYPELFNLNPSLQQIADITTTLIASNLTDLDVNDPAAVYEATTVFFDNRVQNLSITKLDALDISVQYSTETGIGTVDLGVRASRIFGFEERARAEAAAIPRVNTVLFPVDLNARAHVGLQHEQWSARLNLNYVDKYSNPFTEGNPTVHAWTTLDIVLSRTFSGGEHAWLEGARLGLAVQNLLDDEPPFVALGGTTNTALLEPIGFDPANASPVGRFVSLQLSKQW